MLGSVVTATIVSVVLLLYYLIFEKEKNLSVKLLVILTVIADFAMAVWWIVNGKIHTRLILCIIMSVVMLEHTLIVVFQYYIADEIVRKTAFKKLLPMAAISSGLLFFILWIVAILSVGSDMFITMSKSGSVDFSDNYWFNQLAVGGIVLLDVSVLIIRRKDIDPAELCACLSFLFCFIVAGFLQFFFGPSVLCPVLTISVLTVVLIGERRKQIKLLEYKIKSEENHRLLMLSQMRPHFMYNTLSAITVLCDLDPPQARDTTIKFCDYLRYNMQSLSKSALIPIEKELKHVETYLSIEQVRFGDRVKYEFDFRATDFLIPMLTVQPLVENSVKHGIGRKREGGTVWISTWEESGYCFVNVKDNGIGFDLSSYVLEDERVHLGLNATQQRIKDLCHGTVSVESKVGEGTSITIKIPKIESNSQNRVSEGQIL